MSAALEGQRIEFLCRHVRDAIGEVNRALDQVSHHNINFPEGGEVNKLIRDDLLQVKASLEEIRRKLKDEAKINISCLFEQPRG